MFHALAQAFGLLVGAIDWRHVHPYIAGPDHERVPYTRDEIIASMVRLAGEPGTSSWDAGYIRPQLHESPRLLGCWSL